MNKWWLVIIAAFFEVGWATGLKYADSFGAWTLTVIAIVISFWLLVRAATSLPTSTVYAIFVALGTVGTVAVDLLFFSAPFNLWMLVFIALLLVGVIGLKVVTGSLDEEEEVKR
ncbi:DMT family transporter [Geomicrobium sediminis]|uniref:Paired small multidrug resistance pump n=1 Tax=Geomicrobium sediminis TaxID=1347788 RepID=A0ABS2PIF3_9BACL|nr:multidrug efflux SMR transporter [Geomicrobium sediminis]MBM7635052.1 paired small multidrug resistance pump [Geomicrobium sediminis]